MDFINKAKRVEMLSLRGKLLMLNFVVCAALVWLSVQAWHALNAQDQAQGKLVMLSEAFHLSKQADMVHDALRADVMESLVVGEIPGMTPKDTLRQVLDDVKDFQEAFDGLASFKLTASLNDQIAHTRVMALDYEKSAQAVVESAARQKSDALAQIPAFETQFKVMYKALDEQGLALQAELKSAHASATRDADAARQSLLWMCGWTILVASAFVVLVAMAIRHRLSSLVTVARAIAEGDLERRVDSSSKDELGDLGNAIDQMASNLSQTIQSMRNDASRAIFSKQLGEALDMADREAQVSMVTARAMTEISPQHPMELLLADSSRAQMERAAEHPNAGAPGCGVHSPYDCVAVRRGSTVSFDSSESLNACDKLRGRPCGSVSAVCVPVTFMGRAIGVIHATGNVDQALSPEQVRQLSTLGRQIGMRIATVRAFEKTQIQAETDSLTGLPNRRTLEERMRRLATAGKEFAVVMCDLDHFKNLNDSHGHAAGDSALRMFAETLKCALRDSDLAGRWGGEEFVFVLAGAQAKAATEMVDRFRKRLATALQIGKTPKFTASFGISDSQMSSVPEQLIELADVALYLAKTQGRDRACVADTVVDQKGAALRLAEPSEHGINVRQTVAAVA